MAVYNEILAGRFNRALQKIMGIKGPPPTPQLSSEIMPVISMFYGVEHRYLEGWNRFFFNVGVPAGGAGTFATVRVTNPLNSGVVAVFEKITWLTNNSLTFMNMNLNRPAVANLATVTGGSPADGRIRGNLSSVVVSFGTPAAQSGTAVGGLAANNASTAMADMILTDDQEQVLTPNDGWDFSITVANAPISNMILWWRERPLEDSEKA